ncbi:arginase family protein [Candidatus Marsarchaeota archaeon]|nr:arginase family protein [Candidatus Marsarchaeota archaeon]
MRPNSKNEIVLPINNSSFEKAKFVVIGVPDDSGSSYRKGAAKAPDAIRKIANMNEIGVVIRNNKKSLFEPQFEKFAAKVHDYGNVKKNKIKNEISRITKNNKFPILIGGDHSITYEAVSGFSPKEKWSIVYLDAHPDFICSKNRYFGSVLCDISKLENIDMKSSWIIGVRTPEEEEIMNIRKSGINFVDAVDIADKGIKKIVKMVKENVSKNVYMSIDMDVVDSAFVPGVTEPEPAGISSNELVYFVKEVASKINMGFDLMEVCPRYDIKNQTTYLAYRVILEAISSINEKYKNTNQAFKDV